MTRAAARQRVWQRLAALLKHDICVDVDVEWLEKHASPDGKGTLCNQPPLNSMDRACLRAAARDVLEELTKKAEKL